MAAFFCVAFAICVKRVPKTEEDNADVLAMFFEQSR